MKKELCYFRGCSRISVGGGPPRAKPSHTLLKLKNKKNKECLGVVGPVSGFGGTKTRPTKRSYEV